MFDDEAICCEAGPGVWGKAPVPVLALHLAFTGACPLHSHARCDCSPGGLLEPLLAEPAGDVQACFHQQETFDLHAVMQLITPVGMQRLRCPLMAPEPSADLHCLFCRSSLQDPTWIIQASGIRCTAEGAPQRPARVHVKAGKRCPRGSLFCSARHTVWQGCCPKLANPTSPHSLASIGAMTLPEDQPAV